MNTQAQVEAEILFNGGDERAAQAIVASNTSKDENKDKAAKAA